MELPCYGHGSMFSEMLSRSDVSGNGKLSIDEFNHAISNIIEDSNIPSPDKEILITSMEGLIGYWGSWNDLKIEFHKETGSDSELSLEEFET